MKTPSPLLFQDCFQTLMLLVDLAVKLRVVDGDCRLIGEALQGFQVLLRNAGLIGAEHDEQAEGVAREDERHGDRLRQAGVDMVSHFAQLAIQEFTTESAFPLAASSVLAAFAVELGQIVGGDATISANGKSAIVLVAQGDDAHAAR